MVPIVDYESLHRYIITNVQKTNIHVLSVLHHQIHQLFLETLNKILQLLPSYRFCFLNLVNYYYFVLNYVLKHLKIFYYFHVWSESIGYIKYNLSFIKMNIFGFVVNYWDSTAKLIFTRNVRQARNSIPFWVRLIL